jgi:microcompartment protein CcmK/EutM
MNWRQRVLIVLLVIILASVTALVVPAVRAPVLQGLGGLLVAPEPALGRADVIVVAVDAGGAGVLEAADLVAAGVSQRVAAFAPPTSPVDLELLRRGAPVEDLESRYALQLRALGVGETMTLPRVSGSEEQALVLPDWCERHGIRSIVLVTSWHHSRRLGRLLERSLKDQPIVATVRISRYTEAGADRWWETRQGARIGIIELQKLLWDFVRHPW